MSAAVEPGTEFARLGLLKANQQIQQRSFARSGISQHRSDAGFNAQRDFAQSLPQSDTFELPQCVAHDGAHQRRVPRAASKMKIGAANAAHVIADNAAICP